MKRLTGILFFLGICISFITSTAQTRIIDSLRSELIHANNPAQQRTVFMKLCEQNFSLSADSLAAYVRKGLTISSRHSSDYYRFKNFYAFYYFKMGEAEKANLYLDSLLRQSASSNITQAVRLEILYHKTIALVRNNQYQEAIDKGLKFLEGEEKLNDSLSVLKAFVILGWANMELEKEYEVFTWLNKGMSYTKNERLLSQVSSLYLNLASCYNNTGMADSALYFINKGLKYAVDVENLTNQANALNIRASIYSKKKRPNEALQDLEDALVIRKKIGDLHYVISDMGQLSHYYAYINQPEKGMDIAMQGIALAKKTNNLYKLIYLKRGLAKNYEVANRMKEYAETLVEVIQLKDSLYEKNSQNAIAEMETKYELQKKETIISQQETNLIRNRYFTYGSIIAFILGVIIIWLIYRNYAHSQQRKMEQSIAEEKIQSIKAIRFAEEKERKRIAADLHDNLGSYAAAITSNIRYLKENIDGNNDAIVEQLDENAKGIVTQLSDSIWVLKNEQLSITKLADRFKAWAQRIIQNYPKVRYFYEEDISNDVELAPATILNIFLILKECLNNALKHSDCSEIHIKFTSTDELEIRIEDNGKGFESHIINRGNGIENIKYRAKECGLQVNWSTGKDGGTCVSLISTTTN